MLKCIAIDDEPLALRQIESYVEKTPYLGLIAKFDNAIPAVTFLQDHQVDLMFVDINMPDLSGMDFVKSLSNPPKVIFTTAYSEYALEGFKVDAADYLLKPIAYSDFLKSTEKIKERFFSEPQAKDESTDDFLFVKSEYKLVRIDYADILYVESMREYVRIFIEGQKPVMTLMSMKKLMAILPTDRFMRVHRSFVVRLDKVSCIEKSRIIFDKVYIPISDQYKEQFQNYLDTNFLH